MVDFIDDHKKNYGIAPICRVLPIAPSTYCRAKDLNDNPEKRSQRQWHDDFYISEIRRIWLDSKCRYGVRKVWHQMQTEGIKVARCTVERLMRHYGLQDIRRGKGKITTHSRNDQQRAGNLINHNFSAQRPNQLWVSDFTYNQDIETLRVYWRLIYLSQTAMPDKVKLSYYFFSSLKDDT